MAGFQIGMMGLGVMERTWRATCRTASPSPDTTCAGKRSAFAAADAAGALAATDDIPSLAALEQPRKIILLVPSGVVTRRRVP